MAPTEADPILAVRSDLPVRTETVVRPCGAGQPAGPQERDGAGAARGRVSLEGADSPHSRTARIAAHRRAARPGGRRAARLATNAAEQLRQVKRQIVSQGAAAERADSYPSVFYHVRQQI